MKHSLLLSLLIIVCLGVYGKPSNRDIQNLRIDSLQTTVGSQQSTIATLQDSIRNLQMQMNNMKEKVDTYQKVASDTNSYMHNDMSDMLTKIAIIMAIFGVIFPLYFNHRSEKYMEKLLEDAKDKAENAKNALNDLQPKVEKAEGVVTTIEGLKGNVDEAAKKAKAIQYFVQALQESDEKRAITLYDNCIAQDPNFAEAFNNRGLLRYKIGGPDAMKEAKDDYSKAIELFEKEDRGIYAEAYNNRGILYFENNDLKEAENDFNEAITKDYAEAYLCRGLLYCQRGNEDAADDDFNNAIVNKPDFAEAFYIRGLLEYSSVFREEDGIRDLIKAKDFKPNVVEALPIHNLLTDTMKEVHNFIYRVDYSKDMTKLNSVPKDKIDPFRILVSVTEIGQGAFRGCSNLTSIDIPNSVKIIGDSAFSDCTNLSMITIPNGVTRIGDSAFANCTKITSIEIPDSVTKIGDWAFDNCNSLILIKIPDSVKDIGYGVFSICNALQQIIVDEKNPYYRSEDGSLYSKDMKTLIAVPGGKKSIIIPDSITKINNDAFLRCSNLKEIHLKITIPKSFWGVFWGIDVTQVTIYVPKGSVSAYQNSEYYKGFNIEEEKEE